MRFPSVIVFSSHVNIVYSVNSVYRLKTVFDFAFSMSVLLQMVFNTRCVCPKHDTWKHGDIVAGDLRVAAIKELSFSDIDYSKNKGRSMCSVSKLVKPTNQLKYIFLDYMFSFGNIVSDFHV